ncbi:MAG: glycosyltransferase family 2 protein [Acetobacteraceae bacterium]|nr:glycosyltransferase family 2 protein [Acetobacteraceae bacterium]
MTASATHLVLIPAYNAGPALRRTVAAALAQWEPVWVVDDGSADGSAAGLEAAGVRVLRRDRNGGKGAAVRTGLLEAERARFTHVLVMDADGQHPAEEIRRFMDRSVAQPAAMILGQPQFGADAPRARVLGRQVANALTATLTAGYGVGDALFGFRVYPIRPLLDTMQESKWMQRFDFDAEALIRLAWRGVTPVKLPVRVRYFSPSEGGVSHYRYLWDNLLLGWMHLRLLGSLLSRK